MSGERRRVLGLRGLPASVTMARHFVRDVLRSWDMQELVDDAQLGTSELVANAIRHAGTDLVLEISADDGVTISIHDGRPELRRPVMPDAGELAERGRGLHIVAAISQDWGITAKGQGKVVWFKLGVADPTVGDADVLALRVPNQSTARQRAGRDAAGDGPLERTGG